MICLTTNIYLPCALRLVPCAIIISILLLTACQSPPKEIPYPYLSDYDLFENNNGLVGKDGAELYELNTPLFTDYAHKARFVKLPGGKTAGTDENGMVVFPDGSMLVKTFYYPADFNEPTENIDLVETRLLIKKEDKWEAFTYIWDAEQKDAKLSLIGGFRDVSWVDEMGNTQNIQYAIPNKNQCKSCHNIDNKLMPIGPKLANLPKGFPYLPEDQTPKTLMAKWDDPSTGSLQDRALAYLDVNCGHCHNPDGPAHTSGLYLTFDQADPAKWGLCKIPVAAGKGSGGRRFGIAPGQPDSSILVFRMEAEDPGIMMPELGRVIPHQEGVALIRSWIASMEEGCK